MKKRLYGLTFVICFATLSACGVFAPKPAAPDPVAPHSVTSGAKVLPQATVEMTVTPAPSYIPEASPTVTLTPVITPEPSLTDMFQTIPFDWSQWRYYPLRDFVSNDRVKNTILTVKWDKNNQAWIGTAGGFYQYDFDQDQWIVHSDSTIRSIGFDQKGALWMALADHIDGKLFTGVATFDGEFREYFAMPDIPEAVGVTEDGEVWVSYVASAQHEQGVERFDGHKWEKVQIGEGSLEDQVWSIAVTPDQSVWFGTDFDGVYRLKDGQWSHFGWDTFSEARPNLYNFPYRVKDLTVAPDSTLWGTFGLTGGGIIHYDGQTWEIYPFSSSSDSGLMAVAVSQDGRVWVGEHLGHELSYLENGQWYSFQGLPFHVVYDVSIGPDQSIWVSTDYGLYVYSP